MEEIITASVYRTKISGVWYYQACMVDHRDGEKWMGRLTDDLLIATAELRQKVYIVYECVS